MVDAMRRGGTARQGASRPFERARAGAAQKASDHHAIVPARRRRWQLALLTLAVFAYTTLPTAVSLPFSGRVSIQNSTGSVAITGLGQQIQQMLPMVVVVVSLLIVMRNGVKNHASGRVLASYLAGLFLIAAVQAYHTHDLHISNLLMILVSASIALWSIDLRLEDTVVFAYIGVGVAIICLIMAVTTDLAWTGADEDTKALIGSRTLAGFFSQMNVLAMSVATPLPFVFLIQRRVTRWISVIVILVTLVLASSRTTLIAVGVSLVAMIALFAFSRRTRLKAVVPIVIVVGVVASLVPWFITDDKIFTGRGLVWRVSTDLVSQHWLFGFGPKGFALDGDVQQITGALYWHAHNTVLDFLMFDGLVGILALVCFFGPLFQQSTKRVDGSLVPAMLLIMILGIGIAESALRPDVVDGASWITWLSVLATGMLVREGPSTQLSGDQILPASAAVARR